MKIARLHSLLHTLIDALLSPLRMTTKKEDFETPARRLPIWLYAEK
jgi:hypothetical protein